MHDLMDSYNTFRANKHWSTVNKELSGDHRLEIHKHLHRLIFLHPNRGDQHHTGCPPRSQCRPHVRDTLIVL